VDEAKVIDRFLLVPDKDSPAFRKPCEGPLHHPPARWEDFSPRLIQFLLPYTPDVRDVTMRGGDFTPNRVVVSLVEAQML
jgi:hypothetical protein